MGRPGAARRAFVVGGPAGREPGRAVPAAATGSVEPVTHTIPQTAVSAARPSPEELLARFGLEAFRPGQREAVEAARIADAVLAADNF